MPLIYATPGSSLIILKINGLTKVQNHLRDLGFVPGSEIELVSVSNLGVICKIKGVRVALDRDLAMKIIV